MATGIPNLTNAAINLAALRERSRKELTDILDSARGRKALILDPQISGPLGLVAEVSLLKEHGVEKIYYLSSKLDTDCKNLIYLVRPKVANMKMIAANVRQHDLENTANNNYSSKQKKEYSVYFIPRRTMICEKVLEEEGVAGDIDIGEYQLDLIPFDEDVLSLELNTSFRECLLDGDKTSLYYVARAIMKLQSNFGIIPNVKGKGSCSRLVYEMMVRMRKELGADEPTLTPKIDTIILLDREADMITPCCSQLTYEGLIDELLQIQNGFLEIEPESVGAPTPANTPVGKKVKIPLNGNDKVYSDIRNMNISQVAGTLNKKAKELKEYQDSRHNASVTQLRDFTKRLGSAQQEGTSVRIHINLLQKINDYTGSSIFMKRVETEQSLLSGIDFDLCVEYVEECINKKEPIVKVLRLFILLNLTSNGLKAKQLEFFKREILQTYGYQYLFTLNNLEKLNLIKKPDTKPNFQLVRNRLHLLNVEGLDIANPNDIAYVYSGYAPLSVRLVQHAVRPGGWRQIEDSLRALPGPQAFEEAQPLPPGLVAPSTLSSDTPPVTLVFFIGGVTFTEIAALRFLSTQTHRDFIVATTKLINGDSLVESLIENITEAR